MEEPPLKKRRTEDGSLQHPLGVKPSGNRFFTVNRRDIGLGNLWKFSDEFVVKIFNFLDAKSLLRIMAVNKVLYAFANFDDIWRQRTLESFEGDFRFENSWKHTYLHKIFPDATLKTSQVEFDSGVCSDFLFQSWFYGHCRIEPHWLEGASIDVFSDLSLEDFQQKYELPNQPVVIRDLVSKWPAFEKWNWDYLEKRNGETKFLCGGYSFRLTDYISYVKQIKDDQIIYLFDKHFGTNTTLSEEYKVPKYFQEDLFKVLGDSRPDYRWIIAGPKGSGSSFHKDPNGTQAWNATVVGRKKWIMFPPNVVPPGVMPSPDGGTVVTPVSLMEWFVNYYDQAKEMNPREVITERGDLIYVPHGWWHAVLNLEPCIAVTQNYVSQSNLFYVWKFLENKKHAISGVEDTRKNGFVKELERGLKRHAPDAWKNLQEKVEAKKESKKLAQAFDTKKSGFSFGFNL